MAQEEVAVQEFSTARGNTLTVLIDLADGRVRLVPQGRRLMDALHEAAPKEDNLRFQASSAA